MLGLTIHMNNSYYFFCLGGVWKFIARLVVTDMQSKGDKRSAIYRGSW